MPHSETNHNTPDVATTVKPGGGLSGKVIPIPLDDTATAATPAGQASWDPPLSFATHELPSFPIDVLPEALRSWVEAEAEATQTPPDLAAFCAFSTVAAAAQKGALARIRPGWDEPLGLFTMVAMRPASRKSAVFADATRPLVDLECEETERRGPEIIEAQARVRVARKRLDLAESQRARAKPDNRDAAEAEMIDASAEYAAVEEPMLSRWIINDATPEATVRAMQEAGGRTAIMSAEGGVVDIMGGRYSDGRPNLDVYLHGHAGETVRVHRMSRPPEHIHAATMTICLAVQPVVLAGLDPHRGRGLPARFLYALPDDLVGHRRDNAPPVSDLIASRYRRIVRDIAMLPFAADKGEIRSRPIVFEPGARAAIEAYHDELEPRLARDLAWMADWGGKLRGQLARIATLCRIVESVDEDHGWPDAVDGDTMARVLTLAPYLIAHASAALGEMGADPLIADARRILAWLERAHPEDITVREVQRGAFGGRGRAPTIRDAISVLVERGYLRENSRDSYEVHPCLR